MNDRWLVSSFTASSLIHLSLIPVAASDNARKAAQTDHGAHRARRGAAGRAAEKSRSPAASAASKPKPQNITAPKLLSKPVFETSPLPPTGNTKEEIKEKPVEQPLASLPDNTGCRQGRLERGLKGNRSGRQRRRRRQSFRQRSTWESSPAAASKGAVADAAHQASDEAPKATAPAAVSAQAKLCPAWPGRSAAIKSNRAIRSRRAERACRA